MASTRIDIRRALAAELVDLRHAVLRQGLHRQTAVFDGDEEPDTLHLVAVTPAGAVVGCATLLLRPYPQTGEPGRQLRGMAVLPELRSRGIGRRLLDEGERVLRDRPGPRLLWCQARTPAVPFYERSGWKRVGDEFVVGKAGPHYLMFKRLVEGPASPPVGQG